MSEGKSPRRDRDRDRLDDVLASWPATERSAVEWDENAEAIVARLDAPGTRHERPSVSDEDLLAPALPGTADEVTSSAPSMSNTGNTTASRQRDRANLKELAKLAEMGPGATSSKPTSMFPETKATRESVPPADEGAPREENSGMINLASMAAAEAAPASAPTSGVAAGPAASKATTPARERRERQGSPRWLPWTGLAAAAAVAAGVFVGMHRGAEAPSAIAVAAPSATAAATVAAASPATPKPVVTPIAPGDQGIDPASLPQADPGSPPAAPGKPGTPTPGPAAVAAAASAAPPSATATAAPAPDPKLVAQVPSSTPPQASGSLESLMQQAAGATSATPAAAPTPDAPTTAAPGSVPLQPSLGAIQGALGAALPGARACLEQDDPVSRASVTFQSDGSVKSVSISGGAAGKPAEACIRAALMKARVAPFAKPTFTAPATIRAN